MRLLPVVAWVGVAVLGLALSYARFAEAMASGRPDLESYFLPAARAVGEGRSPYGVSGYVYSPFVAVALAPVANEPWAAAAWTAILILAALLTCVLAVWAAAPRAPALQRAGLTALALVTLLYSWPMTFELWLGQSDTLVMLAMAGGLAADAGARRRVAGFSLGLAAVVKTWPAGLLLWLVRSPRQRRAQEWAGVGLAALLTIGLALVVGGPRTVVDMVRAPLAAGDQELTAYSVWGAGELLFSDSGQAVPLLISPALRVVTWIAMTAVVLLLLLTVLRRPGNSFIALCNTAFVLILLMPVSHYVYVMVPIPALWWWAARAVEQPRRRLAWLVTVVLIAWWFMAMRRPPAGDGYGWTTWESFVIIFVSTLVAAIVSVIGASQLPARANRDEERSPRTGSAAVAS